MSQSILYSEQEWMENSGLAIQEVPDQISISKNTRIDTQTQDQLKVKHGSAMEPTIQTKPNTNKWNIANA